MRSDIHTQLPNNYCLCSIFRFCFVFVFFFGDVAFSEYFCSILPFSLCMESTPYVFSFRVVFFLPSEHGLDFFYIIM